MSTEPAPISSAVVDAPSICAACGAPLLAGLGACFDCELAHAPAVARRVRRIRWNDAPREPERLGRVLAALCPGVPRDDIAWLARGHGNEILAEVTPEQDRRLGEILLAIVPDAIAFTDAPPREQGIRLNLGGHVREKIGATITIGGIAAYARVPVGLLALVTLGVLVARLPRFVPRRATVTKLHVDALLGVLPEDVLANIRAARTTLATPALLAAFRECVENASLVASSLRSGGQHLEHADVAAADAEIGRLLRALARFATTAEQRSAIPASSRGAGESYRTQGRTHDPGASTLADVGAQLAILQPLAARVAVARREVLPAIDAALTKLTETCATALSSLT